MLMVTAALGSAPNQDQSLIHLCGLGFIPGPYWHRTRGSKALAWVNTIDCGDHGGRNRKLSWWKAWAVQEENVPRSHCVSLPDPQRVLLSKKAWLNMTPSLTPDGPLTEGDTASCILPLSALVMSQLHPHILDAPIEPTLPGTS